MARFTMAIVGAGELLGNELVEVLEQRETPIDDLRLLATEETAGTRVPFKQEELRVEKLTEQAFDGIDVAFFCGGTETSRAFAPVAAQAGAMVIEMSGAFRRDAKIPVIVPEVNPHAIRRQRGMIANPTAATIPLVMALQPIHDEVGISRIVVSTYEAVSDAGKRGILELETQIRHILTQRDVLCQVYPHQIAFNCFPHIGGFLENGSTVEEQSVIEETRFILQDDALRMTVTAVQVPVFYGHSASVNIETGDPITPDEIRKILADAPGVSVVDEPQNHLYPLPIDAAGQDAVFVGRIRQDESVENGINLWIVADNLRRGAALNAVQIAELALRGE